MKYLFPATVRNVVDGDTIDVDLDLGFKLSLNNIRLRLFGINAYEVKMYPGVTVEEKERGLEAKAFLKRLFKSVPNVLIETIKVKEKYGRYLAVVWVPGVACSDHVPTSIEEGIYAFPDTFTPEATLADMKAGIIIDNEDYFNLNYWLVANGYGVEYEL